MALSNLTKVQTVGIGSNIEVVGVITTGQFKSGTSNLHSTGVELTNLNVSGIATIAGNLSIGGTLTYQDVTNIDSVGLITARAGVNVSGGQLDVGSNIKLGNAGVVTATSFVGGLPITSGADNRVITASSASAIQGEANLTFNGTRLHAKGSGEILRLETTASGGGQCYIDFDDETATRASIGMRGSSSDTLTIAALNAGLRFDTSGKVQAMNIAADGKVGVNQSSPYSELDVTSSVEDSTGALAAHGIRLSAVGATDEQVIPITAGFKSQQDRSRAGIGFISKISGSSEGYAGDIGFYTRSAADGSALVRTDEKLRITSTGIIVTGGGTAPNSTDVGSIFMPGGGDLGWLTSSGSITFNAYYAGGWKYVTTGTSHILWASSEGFNFSTASSGSADGTISYSRAMKIFTNNRVSIGDGNSGTPLGALHINTKSTMGTDTALWIGDNTNKRYMAINQVSNSEMFSEMKLQYNDNGTRSVLKLSNPYGPAGYGTAILWQGYNDGQQGMILCQSEGANNAASTMYLNSSSGTFIQGNSSRHVTMPQQPAFLAYHYAHDINYGVGSTLPYPYTVFNTGNHYNTSNSTFTAPTAGRYLFSVNANGNYTSGASGIPRAYWKINGSNVGNAIHLRGSDATHDGLEQRSQTVIFNLSANDTVKVVVGQNQWDLFGANSFTGYLIG